MSSDGLLSSAATSPNEVSTQRGAFWNPSCGSSSLFVQSVPSTSSPLLFWATLFWPLLLFWPLFPFCALAVVLFVLPAVLLALGGRGVVLGGVLPGGRFLRGRFLRGRLLAAGLLLVLVGVRVGILVGPVLCGGLLIVAARFRSIGTTDFDDAVAGVAGVGVCGTARGGQNSHHDGGGAESNPAQGRGMPGCAGRGHGSSVRGSGTG